MPDTWLQRKRACRREALCCALVALCTWQLAGKGDFASRLITAAREQIGVTVRYDGAYRTIPYPNGDVPADRGVRTDVLIRAYRRLGVDLQRLVHEDMIAAWSAYPGFWGLARPDPSIDHRRVPNLATFFARHGEVLPVLGTPIAYSPGDLVTWRLPSGVPHIGIISDDAAPSGSPLVVHNIGRGTVEEDILFRYLITGHYRYPPARQAGAGRFRRDPGVRCRENQAYIQGIPEGGG